MLTLGPQSVLTQAERYSRGITQVPKYQGEFGVPFLYSTNGEQIWFHDSRHERNRSRQVAAFHTPAALRELLERDFEADGRVVADGAAERDLNRRANLLGSGRHAAQS